MKKDPKAKVLSLFISTVDNKKRISKDTLHFDTKGVVEDKFYGKNIERSVLISSIDSYILASKNNIKIEYGLLGENILLNINPYNLAIGTKISIGDVILMITIPCTICDHLSVIDNKLPKLLSKDRGIFAKVIKGGNISLDDIVHII